MITESSGEHIALTPIETGSAKHVLPLIFASVGARHKVQGSKTKHFRSDHFALLSAALSAKDCFLKCKTLANISLYPCFCWGSSLGTVGSSGLEFKGPVNTVKVMSGRSVYLTTVKKKKKKKNPKN